MSSSITVKSEMPVTFEELTAKNDWSDDEVKEIVSKAYYGSSNDVNKMSSLEDYVKKARGRYNEKV